MRAAGALPGSSTPCDRACLLAGLDNMNLLQNRSFVFPYQDHYLILFLHSLRNLTVFARRSLSPSQPPDDSRAAERHDGRHVGEGAEARAGEQGEWGSHCALADSWLAGWLAGWVID